LVVGKIVRERLPEPDRRRADEQHSAFWWRTDPVGSFVCSNFLFPFVEVVGRCGRAGRYARGALRPCGRPCHANESNDCKPDREALGRHRLSFADDGKGFVGWAVPTGHSSSWWAQPPCMEKKQHTASSMSRHTKCREGPCPDCGQCRP